MKRFHVVFYRDSTVIPGIGSGANYDAATPEQALALWRAQFTEEEYPHLEFICIHLLK